MTHVARDQRAVERLLKDRLKAAAKHGKRLLKARYQLFGVIFTFAKLRVENVF